MMLYPIDLNLVIGSDAVLVDVTLAIGFLIDYCLICVGIAENAHEKVMHDYYQRKLHPERYAERPRCFYPVATQRTETASILDLQQMLLQAIQEAQAKQATAIDATKLSD